MRRATRRLIAAASVLVAGVSFAAEVRSDPAPSSPAIADSVRDFSGEQGADGWWYGYWDRSADADGSYDPAEDFQPLEHFGNDPINRLYGHPVFTTGELWYLEDGRYYTSLWAKGGHPHGEMDLGTYARADHWVVRRWVSTTDGVITISGHVGKDMPWGENWGGGVLAEILVAGEAVFRAEIDDGGTDYTIDATVEVGSFVEFLIGPDESIGVIDFTGVIRTAPESSP